MQFLAIKIFAISLFSLRVYCLNIGDGRALAPHKGLCLFSMKDGNETLYFDFTPLPSVHMSYSNETRVMDHTLHLKMCRFYGTDSFILPHHFTDNPCESEELACIDELYIIHNIYLSTPTYGDLKREGDNLQFKVNFPVFDTNTARHFKSWINITFVCNGTEKYPEIQKLTLNKPHNFQLIWMTSAACPISDYIVRKACLYKIPDTLYTADLSSLRRQTYIMHSGFEVNICGAISNGTCEGMDVTVCEIDTKKVIARADNYEISRSDDGFVIKQKNHGKKAMKVEIRLICTWGASTSGGDFQKLVGSKYWIKFSIKTPLACVPPQFECVFNTVANDPHRDKIYLLPLHKRSGNYHLNTEKGVFDINICGPVNPTQELSSSCSGYLAGCQESALPPFKARYSLFWEKVVVEETGKISFIFGSNETCPEKLDYNLKLNVTIICATESTLAQDRDVLLFIKNENCADHLEMKSEHACPKQVYFSSDCKLQVTRPSYHEFDFNPYKNTNTIVYDGVDSLYRFKLCDGTSVLPIGLDESSCAAASNASMCAIHWRKEVAIGGTPALLKFVEGSIFFEMMGDPCRKHGPYSHVVFNVKCDHSPGIWQLPKLVSANMTECVFTFDWNVDGACRTLHRNQLYCKNVPSRVKHFANYNRNYLFLKAKKGYTNAAPSKENSFVAVVLNICTPLVDGKDAVCNEGDAACLITRNVKTNQMESYSLGEIDSARFSGNTLLYESYKLCMSNLTKKYKADVTFECQLSFEDSDMEFLGSDDACTYKFHWKNYAYCTEADILKHVSDQRCKFKENSGDFDDVMNNITFVAKSIHTSLKYSFVPCPLHYNERVKNYPCERGVSVCVEMENGSKLHYGYHMQGYSLFYEVPVRRGIEHGMIFVYEGDTCPNKQEGFPQNYTVVVKLICTEQNREAMILDENDCFASLIFFTPLACSNVTKSCEIELEYLTNLEIYDKKLRLDEILPIENNYLKSPTGYLVFTRCKHFKKSKDQEQTSAADKVVMGFEMSQDIDTQGRYTITFVQGSVCQGFLNGMESIRTTSYFPSRVFMQSKLALECDYESEGKFGHYAYVNHKFCQYDFIWYTREVCPSQGITILNNCSAVDERNNLLVDLKAFAGHRIIQIGDNNSTLSYTLEFCKERHVVKFEKENGSRVMAYELKTPQISFYPERNYTVLSFYSDKNENHLAELRLKCLQNWFESEKWTVIKDLEKFTILQVESDRACFYTLEELDRRYGTVWKNQTAEDETPFVYMVLSGIGSFLLLVFMIWRMNWMPGVFRRIHVRFFNFHFVHRVPNSSPAATDEIQLVATSHVSRASENLQESLL